MRRGTDRLGQVWQSGFTAKAAIVRSTTHLKLGTEPQDCRKLYRLKATTSPNDKIFVRMVFDSQK
jgi:hypothetical protein